MSALPIEVRTNTEAADGQAKGYVVCFACDGKSDTLGVCSNCGHDAASGTSS